MLETIIRSELATWGELDEADRRVVRERIAKGELPASFRVTQHRHYVGARARHRYLEPEPLRRARGRKGHGAAEALARREGLAVALPDGGSEA
jgi:hypothetical protein